MKGRKHTEKTLIYKVLREFAVCAAILFVLSAPLFYLLTKQYYAEDMIDVIEAVQRGEAIPSLDLEEDIMEGMAIHYFLIFFATMLALFVTIRFVTKRLWQPFDDTLRKVERFNLQQGGIPQFADTDVEEFRRLNQSLTQLMRKDQRAYRIQKEFTENASHELQTPLAIIRSKLDLLMQEDMTEAQARIVSDLYELTIRMGNLNRNLLLLAKIENAQYHATEEVDIAALLTETMPLYDTLRHGHTLTLDDQRTQKGVKLQANAALLESLLKNLIVNSIRHSKSQGKIKIVVADDRLVVSNASEDGKPLDAASLFHRFSKSDVSQKGNGLGLAIVKAICDFHQWTVEYAFHAGQHQFVVHF